MMSTIDCQRAVPIIFFRLGREIITKYSVLSAQLAKRRFLR